ncbi:MAG: hypothetical protein ACREOJ_18460 [Gemmatimonadaceae bacterium]
MDPTLPATLSGVAGEYYVAAELSRHGYVASITLRNTRGIDILASNPDATSAVGIQVKTRQGATSDWVLDQSIETEDMAANLFFVFVRLVPGVPPKYHVVPRSVVRDYAMQFHRDWLAQPKRDGSARKDGRMRKFADTNDAYHDRWDLLGLDAPAG